MYLIESIRAFMRLNGNYLRLVKLPPTGKRISVKCNHYFGILRKNILYRHNCVYSIWNINTLLGIINLEENAWEFEKKGDIRTAYLDGFYLSNVNCFCILNTVVKGKWVKKKLELIKREIPDLIIGRDILTKKEERKLSYRMLLFSLYLNVIPLRLQKPFLKLLKMR